MGDRKRYLALSALVTVCFASFAPYAAQAQDATAVETTDVEVADAAAAGLIPVPVPPIHVQIEEPGVSEPSISSPEEEDLTEGVNVADPGPILPVDPGVTDQLVVANVGELPDEAAIAGTGLQTMKDESPAAGDCSAATPKAPVKNQMKIEGAGAISCASVQRSLNVVVCIDYRPAGKWETVACKPKTASNVRSADKKVSTACVAGRFFYRVRVYGVAKAAKTGAETSIPERTTPTSGRIFCAS